ncbi:MAG TPA: nucleotidyltransferase family protein, partial [Candidatus Nitrosotenuis sp.]|nr:nucleotidyltransferase family protein [Candidatus Nitrosotenuis sp.]
MRGAAVVLAAGASTRMGRPKADLPYLGGTFLSLVLERLEVVGADWLRVVVAPGAEVPGALQNPDPAPGPISSIQLALRAGAAEEPWLLVARVDYPAVQASTYAALARAARAGG